MKEAVLKSIFVLFCLSPFIVIVWYGGKDALVVIGVIVFVMAFILFGKCFECRVMSGKWPWNHSTERFGK